MVSRILDWSFSYSKATVSPTAALRGGKEFSTLSSKSDNCANNCINFSTLSVSAECKNGNCASVVSSEYKNWENHTCFQVIYITKYSNKDVPSS